MPPGMVITLLADRGFVHEQLLHYLRTQQWHFRLRLTSKTLVHLEAGSVSAVKDLCPPGFRAAVLSAGSDSRSRRGASLSCSHLPA
jgi:hypothetical protein